MVDQQNLEKKQKITIESLVLFNNLTSVKLGQDYDAEIIISSKGDYLFTCICDATNIGSLKQLSIWEPHIPCNSCGIQIKSYKFLDLKGKGPQAYKINVPNKELYLNRDLQKS